MFMSDQRHVSAGSEFGDVAEKFKISSAGQFDALSVLLTG